MQDLTPLRLVLLSGLLLAALPASSSDPATVEISVDRSAASTRLVLTHSRQVGYVIEEVRGKVRIRYTESIDLRPPTSRFDDPVLRRYRMRDTRTLTLETGPDYDRYDSFELRNPFRVVLDLRKAPQRVQRGKTRRSRYEPSTIIVIDPGHGGIENGAVGPTGLIEKEVTLTLARRLKRVLERGRPSLSVVLTRDEDRLLGLDERTAIANHNRADLFVSIHLNASSQSAATGAETYYLSSDATDAEARILAARENLSPQGSRELPPDLADLELVLWDLAQNRYLAESGALAESIQRQLNQLTGTRNRGVRQAPFRVLMGAMMPAVLVEVGFVSNEKQEALLRSSRYRNDIVNAVAAAVDEFLNNLESLSAPKSYGARREP
jgi:N-acetylmuramoyl-L-alanine amidase